MGEITRALIRLRAALDTGGGELARTVCDEVATLQHNSGPLVPSREAWERSPYLRRKWPMLCEEP